MEGSLKKYPDLERIVNLYPGPQVLLGGHLFWTEKRDGTQLRVTLVDGEIVVSTKNQYRASGQFLSYFEGTAQYPLVKEFLHDHFLGDFLTFPIVFGELLVKGKSPARFEAHEEHSFVVFDIFSQKSDNFLGYNLLAQECYHYNLPVVSCWAMSQHTTLEGLYIIRDEMLQVAATEKREGVVVKCYTAPSGGAVFAKEKLDMPIIPRIIKEDGAVVLPPLPESELWGAIAKVEADLGEEFYHKEIAMPMIARYVAAEQLKHLCSKPQWKLFDAYCHYKAERLKEGGT